jgi:hypothetical protein
MWSIRNMVITGAAIIAAGSAWHVKSIAQENAASGVGVVTVFDHAKLDASFANALAYGGTAPLWSRTSSYGTSDVSVHSRESANSACPPQGCSHKGFTAVASARGWEEYAYPDHAFSVAFPANPRVEPTTYHVTGPAPRYNGRASPRPCTSESCPEA